MRGKVKSVRPLLEPRKFVLSGTPVSESPMNAFPVLSILAPETIPSRARFDQHFVVRAKTRAGPVTTNKAMSFQNLEELKRRLESVSIRRLKVDVHGMPDRTEDVRHCRMTSDQRGHYEEVMRGIMAEIEGDPDWARTLDIACVKLLRARQVLNHPALLDLSGDSGKYLALDDLVEEVLSNPAAKLVVWSSWNRAIDLLAERYREFRPITIDQRTSQQDLVRWDKEFDLDDHRIAIASPARGGTGIDFLSRARVAIYCEKTYSLVNHLQSTDRIVRRVPDDQPGDDDRVRWVRQIKRSSATILYLHAPGSVDDIVDFVLKKKLDMGTALLTSDERLIADGRHDLIRMLRDRVSIAH
jgi:SNF2 family DNA or RNA helicase